MTNRNDFVTRPATLDRWEIKRTTAATSPHVVFEVTCIGYCDRKKKPLFSHSEVVAPSLEPMKVSDIVHHYGLVLEQDRPTTLERFQRGLMGEHWEQLQLDV